MVKYVSNRLRKIKSAYTRNEIRKAKLQRQEKERETVSNI